MEKNLESCLEQLDRYAHFPLIVECEPFTPIYDRGVEWSSAAWFVSIFLSVFLCGLTVFIVRFAVDKL